MTALITIAPPATGRPPIAAIRPIRAALIPAIAIALLSLAACASPQRLQHPGTTSYIDYHVSVPDSTADHFTVTAEVRGVAGDTVMFDFPMWGPGAYDIVNFGSYVEDFEATSEQTGKLETARRDLNSFAIIGADGAFDIRYNVRRIRQIPSSIWFCISDIGKDYAFANAVALFGYPEGKKDIPYSVSYLAPHGWDIATALDSAGPNIYRARDYDELVDAPVTMGRFQRADFDVKGKRHTIMLQTFDLSDPVAIRPIADTTARIITLLTDFFGDIPYDHYLFQIYLADPGSRQLHGLSGALEHRNSSTYLVAYFPESSPVQQLKDVIAHEFFHLWSPKRIHVGTLGPFDYQHPPHTSSLWFAEGLTEYYAQTLLSRSGMSSSQGVIREFQSDIQDFYHKPQKRSLAEVSRDISTASQSEMMELYSKGPLLGLLLDIEIRSQSNGERSLDDAMRYFNEEYGKKGRSFADEEIIPIMERATGTRLATLSDRYITGHDPLPLDDYLAKIGMRMVGESKMKRTMGAITEQSAEGITILGIEAGGSAEKMGLRAGDLITKVIIDGDEVRAGGFPPTYEDFLPNLSNTDVKLMVMRDGSLSVLPTIFIERSTTVYHLAVDTAATERAAAMRRSILGF